MQHFHCCVVRPNLHDSVLWRWRVTASSGTGSAAMTDYVRGKTYAGKRMREDVRLAFPSNLSAHVIAGLTRNLNYSVLWRWRVKPAMTDYVGGITYALHFAAYSQRTSLRA